jgi:hypothetical protein
MFAYPTKVTMVQIPKATKPATTRTMKPPQLPRKGFVRIRPGTLCVGAASPAAPRQRDRRRDDQKTEDISEHPDRP